MADILLQILNCMNKFLDLGGVMFMSAFLTVGLLSSLWAPDIAQSELRARYGASSQDVVMVDGLNVYYKDTGPKDAPVLLLLHGFGSSLQTWDLWASQLEAHYRVIRLDLPGFGLTGPSPLHDYSESGDLATVTHFVNKLGVSNFSIIGHSMGGKMAWGLAAAEPDRVKALVLMAPDGFPDAKDIGTKPYQLPAIMGVIKFCLPKYLVRKSIEPAFFDASALSDSLVDRYYDMLRAPGVRNAILERSDQTIYTDPVPRLKKVTAPTLLVWGQEDRMIPSRNAQSYADVLASSKTVLLPKLGHLVQEERPEVALAHVTDFLNSTLK
jgi:pimeloyl-ACP methyl ester carboxylesterase